MADAMSTINVTEHLEFPDSELIHIVHMIITLNCAGCTEFVFSHPLDASKTLEVSIIGSHILVTNTKITKLQLSRFHDTWRKKTICAWIVNAHFVGLPLLPSRTSVSLSKRWLIWGFAALHSLEAGRWWQWVTAPLTIHVEEGAVVCFSCTWTNTHITF